jgi:hypothetical protein
MFEYSLHIYLNQLKLQIICVVSTIESISCIFLSKQRAIMGRIYAYQLSSKPMLDKNPSKNYIFA